jgi:hypothetical protein
VDIFYRYNGNIFPLSNIYHVILATDAKCYRSGSTMFKLQVDMQVASSGEGRAMSHNAT